MTSEWLLVRVLVITYADGNHLLQQQRTLEKTYDVYLRNISCHMQGPIQPVFREIQQADEISHPESSLSSRVSRNVTLTLAPLAWLWSFGFIVSKSPIRVGLQIPQWWQFDSPSLPSLFLSNLTFLLVFFFLAICYCINHLSLTFVSGVFLSQPKQRHYVQAFSFSVRINSSTVDCHPYY